MAVGIELARAMEPLTFFQMEVFNTQSAIRYKSTTQLNTQTYCEKARYTGKQICFGFNEDTLTIYDVTDKANPNVLFRLGYQGSAYTHQGWLNADMSSLLLNDELDEQRGTTNGQRTRTNMWDITNLEAAFESGRFDHPEVSIDSTTNFDHPVT